MKSGLLSPQGNFSADTWLKIYENELTVAATSVTISGLDGNTDVQYRLQCRVVGNADGQGLGIRPNNDSGTNYGYQAVNGNNITVEAGRNTTRTSLLTNYYGLALNSVTFFDVLIYAKSGYLRTAIAKIANSISTTTVTEITLYGLVWNNTADNITNLVTVSNLSNGLGIGTFIELFKPVPKI